jgi:AcrR family transcriptional regulator
MIDEQNVTLVSGENTRRERRDAAEHRRRILQVARTLFAERGVDATRMLEIGRAAGVGQGTLYRRYAHKGALCAALLADSMHQFEADLTPICADETQSALARLEALLVRLIDFNEANAPLLGGIEDAACGSRRGESFRSPFYLWLRGWAVRLLDQAIARGEAPALDVGCAADFVLAPLAIDVYLHQRREQGVAPEQIAATVRQVLLDGLRTRVVAGARA